MSSEEPGRLSRANHQALRPEQDISGKTTACCTRRQLRPRLPNRLPPLLRDSRWILPDLGKKNRLRTILVPAWVKSIVDEWFDRAGIATGLLQVDINYPLFELFLKAGSTKSG